MLNDNLISLEDEIDFELGAGKIRKKLKKAVKKIGKGIAVVGTGGLAGAAMLAKKKAAKSKIAKKAKSVAAKAKAVLGVKATSKPAPKAKPAAKKAPAKAAPKIVKAVQAKTASQCCDKNELAALVAAKLVAQLGPPLDAANKVLKRFELQNTATYEHKKLMSDADFRREVLTRLATKAANGNTSCERTIRVIMGR